MQNAKSNDFEKHELDEIVNIFAPSILTLKGKK
jgi:hypothetical protein